MTSQAQALAPLDGAVVASGPIAEALTAETLTETFGAPIVLNEDGGRYAARAAS